MTTALDAPIAARHPVAVGIVADDLTGANDAAVQFARHGWHARLALADLSSAVTAGGAVTAVVTDARAHSDDAARAETAAAVAGLAESGADRVFVKIDSTMRGTVGAQIAGALDAWRTRHPDGVAIVCPAYPAMGRTVESGHVLVGGVGVQTTSVGRDPVTPVTTSSLAQLLPGSVATTPGADLVSRIETAVASGLRVVTVDASTDTDVRAIGAAILRLGARAVPVGSAGLAGVMAELWAAGSGTAEPVSPSERSQRNRSGGVVVQVSSLHDVSRSQHAHLASSSSGASTHTFAPALADVLGADVATAWIARELASLYPLPAVFAILSPAERGATADASERVADGLAAITDAVLHHSDATALVLMGGEGARAVLSRLGADAIRVTDAIREGIPIGIVEGGRMHGLTVVTKAGGFGTETSLTDILPELASDSDALQPLEPRRTP